MRTVVCRFHLYPTVWFSSLYHTVILYDAIMAYPALICTIFTMLCMPGRTSSNLICAHSSGFLLYRMFCMQTGRMSGIRRSRPSSCCSLKCWNLKSLHASWYHFLLFSYRGHNTPNLNEIIPYDFLLCNGFYCRDAGKSGTEIHFLSA